MPHCLFRIVSLPVVLFMLLGSIVVDAQPVPRVVGTVRDGDQGVLHVLFGSALQLVPLLMRPQN